MEGILMTINEIKELKERLGLTNKDIATRSGVPYGTVIKIMSGSTKSPSAKALDAIANSLKEFIYDESAFLTIPFLPKDRFSVNDYYNLPADIRVELIDGKFYNLAAPSTNHQDIIGNLYFYIRSYIMNKGGDCKPFISPIDVQLDCDDKTVVQPDLIIVCNKNKITDKNIYGAPDFIAEIVSQSTKEKDYIIKLKKYKSAGVKEYWIIDKEQNQVTIYTNLDSNEDMSLKIYPLDAKIPVGIYDDLILDMSQII